MELLKEKVEFGLNKVKSSSFLSIRLEPSSNTKFLRKIEKHELVTDYEMQPEEGKEGQLVSFKQTSITNLSDPHSFLEVVAHQDHRMSLGSPMLEQRFINTNSLRGQWKETEVASWLTETGRFQKLFREQRMVGKGGFGKVFKAWNIFDQR